MNYLDKIKKIINENLRPEKISIIDNSSLHASHKSFIPGKVHIKLKIHSEKLKKMKSIEAHKLIFSILKEEMDNKIHALEIEIK
tara:strand:- start:546 stop:797 length:252 start_codon:yes stop_codon:yes gene_type:complete